MIRRLTCMLMGLLLAAAPALAQKPYEAPKYSSKDRSTMIEWGIGAGFLIGCLVVAFKPSKRSNLK